LAPRAGLVIPRQTFVRRSHNGRTAAGALRKARSDRPAGFHGTTRWDDRSSFRGHPIHRY
jgi:hypothetical protein